MVIVRNGIEYETVTALPLAPFRSGRTLIRDSFLVTLKRIMDLLSISRSVVVVVVDEQEGKI